MKKDLKEDEEFKGFLLLIYRNQLDIFTGKHFNDEFSKKLKTVTERCFNWGVDLVILFINKERGNFSCPCYMPIFFNRGDLKQCGSRITDIEKCIALPAHYIKTIQNLPEGHLFDIISTAANYGFWYKEYAFGVFDEQGDNEMYKLNTKPFSDIRVTRDTLDFEAEQIELYKEMLEANPNNKYLKQARNILVRQYTDHQNELNLALGITKQQYAVFDYALRMPEVLDGKFDATCFEPFIEFVVTFFKKFYKSLEHAFFLKVAAAGAGSAVLFIDLIPKDTDTDTDKKINSSWKKGKEHLKKTVEALPALTVQGDANKRVNTFCEKAKLGPEEAKVVLKTVQKIFPKSTDKKGIIEVYTQSNEKPVAKFDQSGADYFRKAKKDLVDSLKPEEDTTISGFLGLIVGWEEEKPRFIIQTDEKRRLTIYFDKSKTNEVRDRFKQNVKFERLKEGRSWFLTKWL